MRWPWFALLALLAVLGLQQLPAAPDGGWTPALDQSGTQPLQAAQPVEGADDAPRFVQGQDGAATPEHGHDGHDHQDPTGPAGHGNGGDWCQQSTGVDADGDGYVDKVPCSPEVAAQWAARLAGLHGTDDRRDRAP